MNIFNHLIKDTEIIGITDINAIKDHRHCAAYTTYSFRVITKSNSFLVVSPEFSDADKKNRFRWLKNYLNIRSLIAEQIGEVTQD